MCNNVYVLVILLLIMANDNNIIINISIINVCVYY